MLEMLLSLEIVRAHHSRRGDVVLPGYQEIRKVRTTLPRPAKSANVKSWTGREDQNAANTCVSCRQRGTFGVWPKSARRPPRVILHEKLVSAEARVSFARQTQHHIHPLLLKYPEWARDFWKDGLTFDARLAVDARYGQVEIREPRPACRCEAVCGQPWRGYTCDVQFDCTRGVYVEERTPRRWP